MVHEVSILYNINVLAKILAVLVAEQGSYTYVDKIGYAPSSDLAVFYLKEALRDYHSLLRKGELENKKIIGIVNSINERIDKVSRDLEVIARITDRQELRRVTSLIASKALAYAASYSSAEKEEMEER